MEPAIDWQLKKMKKQVNTLRVRFALWVAGLLLLTLTAFGGFVYINLAQGLLASIDDSLHLSASQAIAAVNVENGIINFSDSVPEGSNASALRDRGLTIRILFPDGSHAQAFGQFRDVPVPPKDLAAAQSGFSFFTTMAADQGSTVRFYTTPILENGRLIGIVQVAQSLDNRQATLNRLLTALLIGGPLAITFATIGSYYLAAQALAPIDHITQTALRISSEDLAARLNLPASNDEVGRLALAFDSMLARLDVSFNRERRFTADASHELRTPITAMQTILSVIRTQSRTPQDYQMALSDLAEEADRLRALTEDLLQLARSDAEPVTAGRRVDLSTLLNDLTASLQPAAGAKTLSLTSAIPDGLSVWGDSDKLIRLFLNLIENAIKYTAIGAIHVSAQADFTVIRVEVTDTGIGISPAQLPYIFDRFYRGDTARTQGGSGLGLAIALEIAKAHGGSIEASSSPGAGATFQVTLPRAKSS